MSGSQNRIILPSESPRHRVSEMIAGLCPLLRSISQVPGDKIKTRLSQRPTVRLLACCDVELRSEGSNEVDLGSIKFQIPIPKCLQNPNSLVLHSDTCPYRRDIMDTTVLHTRLNHFHPWDETQILRSKVRVKIPRYLGYISTPPSNRHKDLN